MLQVEPAKGTSWWNQPRWLALWAAMATTLGSAVDYFWRFSRAEQQESVPVSDFAAAQARRERAKADRSGAA